jgi:histone-binding protein RBBP4
MSAPSNNVDNAAAATAESSFHNEMKQINEEYKIWKKNTPFLYDLVSCHALEWPSLTIQWFPDRIVPEGCDYSIQRLLLGTHTADSEQNHILIGEIRIPLPDTEIEAGLYSNDPEHSTIANANYANLYGRIEIIQNISHSGEVNRARYQPNNPAIIATKTASADVLLFDRSLHPAKSERNIPSKPQLKLLGHTREGYGLAWNNLQPNYLLSGSEDKLVCLWDTSANPSHNKENQNYLNSFATFRGHTDIVEDVAWSYHNQSVFASCGDDSIIFLWDYRKKEATQKVTGVHKGEINCLAFNPENEHLFVSGSADKTIGLFDIRKINQKLHSFEGHDDQIFTVAWSPHNSTVLASCSSDRRVCVWDLNRIGEEQEPEDAEDGPPELMFIHGGHTDKVADIAWNPHPTEEWLIASVADDNIMQIWQMAENIYQDEDTEEKEKNIDDSQLE